MIESKSTRSRVLLAATTLALAALLHPSTSALAEPAPPPEITDVLAFYDQSIADGSLFGIGPNAKTAKNRENALRNMIRGGGTNVNGGGCESLYEAEKRSDGVPTTNDFVAGSNAPALAQMIDDARKFFGCSVTEVPAGTGGTIEGEAGAFVTVAVNAIPYPAEIGIEPALPTEVLANAGGFNVVSSWALTFNPLLEGPGGVVGPAEPFQVTVPAGPDLALGELLVVGQQVKVFVLDEEDEPTEQEFFEAVAYASVVQGPAGNVIQTQASALSGIFSAGILSFIQTSGSEVSSSGSGSTVVIQSHTTADFLGTATGTVKTSGNAPAVGATVSASAAPWIALSDGSGNYSIPAFGDQATHQFTVHAFAPLTGESGASTSTFPTAANPTAVANINLIQPVPQPGFTFKPTYDGIRNGGFERGDLSSWIFDDGTGLPGTGGGTSSAFVTQQFGPTTTGTTCTAGAAQANPAVCVPDGQGGFIQNPWAGAGTTINPSEGQWMAVIATGPGSATSSTRLTQQFIVPSGVKFLRFDFNFVSEEFPEFVNTIFNDTFKAIITPSGGGEQVIKEVTVNNAGNGGAIIPIGDCGFTEGDQSCGMTGWREGSVDLEAYAGTNQSIRVDLVFSALDAGDQIYDTFVFIDNIRFSTLWLDVKTLSAGTGAGTTADAARIRNDVRRANEILSQAGVNVQTRENGGQPFREVNTSNSPAVSGLGGFLDVSYGNVTLPNLGNTCGTLDDVLKDPIDYVNVPPSVQPVPGIQVFHAHLTAEERAVVNALRSTDPKDLNVYYAGTSERNDKSTNFVQQTGTQSGWSLPPDDYCNPADANVFAQSDAGDHVSIKSAVQTNAGVLIFDKSSSANLGGDVLAHEILHVLLSPYISDSRQEHGTRNTSTNTPGGFGPQADTTNVMIDPQAAGKIGITRDQSRIINRKDFTGSNLPQLLVD